MGLETVVNISDLVKANPTASDPKSQGDDHVRNLKTALLNAFAGFLGAVMVTGTDGGTANAYSLTPANPVPGYGTRMLAVFSPTVANTGAATLNISGLGAKALKSVAGEPLVAGDLQVGTIYGAFYTGAEFRLLSVTKNYMDQLVVSGLVPGVNDPANVGKFFQGGGTWALALPDQTGQAGKTLKTDGAVASWAPEPVSKTFASVPVVALDVDLSLGNYFTKTVAANSTFTFSNVPDAGYSFALELQVDAGTVFQFPATVKAVNNGIVPPLTIGKTHLLMFVKKSGSTRFRMSVAPNSEN